MYYFEGTSGRDHVTIKSGNLLEDISDHLPSYALITSRERSKLQVRPMVRIFSQKNINKFVSILLEANWASVYNETDVNASYNNFSEILCNAYNKSFCLTRLSRKRLNDKKWITPALKKSSTVKNKLYKRWLTTRSDEDEFKYKQYRKVFRQTALEAEKSYYQDMFDAKTNTVKQLWHNLNEVCSFESKAHKTCNIPRLKNNNQIYTKPEDVCNELNSYFSTIGENLVNELMKSNNSNPSFRTYCNSFVKNSMFCGPVDKIELKTLINKLNDRKSSGPDNIGPKLVKKNQLQL
jgi:hypothetical protein